MSPKEVLSYPQRLQLAAILAVLSVIVLVACSACGARMPGGMPTDSDPTVARQISPEGNFQCTAWKVGENLVMTAGHCCEDDTSYTMAGDHAVPGESYTTLVNDDEHDVCVLSGHLDGPVVRIAKRDPYIGEMVWTEGYPRGIFLISTGYWSGRNGDLERGITSSTVGFGSSGSPVLDGDNQAVGVVSARYREMDNLTIVATVEWMRRALQKALL
jgi:hypothetical protein